MDRVTRLWTVATGIAVLLSGSLAACARQGGSPEQADDAAASTQTWLGQGGGFREWGACGSVVYADQVKPHSADVWRWSGEHLTRSCELLLERAINVVWTAKTECVRLPVGGSECSIRITDCDGRNTRELPLPDGWGCNKLGPSGNGEYVGVMLRPERAPKGMEAIDHPLVRVGAFRADANEIGELTELTAPHTGAPGAVQQVVPSPDGKLLVLAGWDNSVALVDLAAKRLLWSNKAGDGISYAAFSPDGRTIYAGGSLGAVHALDAETGQERGRWFASLSGRDEYGHRISCLAVSPDGRWVAAGTGPEGLVFVGSTADMKMVKVLPHGGSTVLIVSFSPDSQALATFVPGTLKTWKLGQWAPTATTTSSPPTGLRPTSQATTAPSTQAAESTRSAPAAQSP